MTRDQLTTDQLHQLQDLHLQYRPFASHAQPGEIPTLIFRAIDSLLQHRSGERANDIRADEVDGLITFYQHEIAVLQHPEMQ